MSADVYRELLRDFRAAEAEWPNKGYQQFSVWARPWPECGLPPQNDAEWRFASVALTFESPRCGYTIYTPHGPHYNGKPVERFIELATKSGAHLSLDFQSHILPKPNSPLKWWIGLMWRLYPPAGIGIDRHSRIFLHDPFRESANAIELCKLHAENPVWPSGNNGPKVGVNETPMTAEDTDPDGDDEQQPDVDTSGFGLAKDQVRAHQHRLFSPDFPDDVNLRDLAVRIDQAPEDGDGKTAIARDFTGENKDSDIKAQRLLSRLRKQKGDGHYFP